MSTKGSVTRWIERLRTGDAEAAQKLWERYYESLVEQARRQLWVKRHPTNDEEDLALLTFEALFRGLRDGRFPLLTDRNGLWSLLLSISRKKMIDAIRYDGRQIRGGGHLQSLGDESFVDAIALEPTPEFAVEVAEELKNLLEQLDDDSLKLVATRKMEGYTNREIARELGCVPRTVERKLNVIRKTWAERE